MHDLSVASCGACCHFERDDAMTANAAAAGQLGVIGGWCKEGPPTTIILPIANPPVMTTSWPAVQSSMSCDRFSPAPPAPSGLVEP